jgi:hypothetical protein
MNLSCMKRTLGQINELGEVTSQFALGIKEKYFTNIEIVPRVLTITKIVCV